MNQQAYLASLKRALSGLPAGLIAEILGDYGQHFVDAMANGRSEEQTARALGDPRKVALEFKAMTHLDAFQSKRSLANFGRMALALVCVAGFNLFLLPFMLVAPLLLVAFYAVSACFFIAGATLAASGLTGVDKLGFEFDGRPMAFVVVDSADRLAAGQSMVRLNVPLYGIHLVDESRGGGRSAANGMPPSDGGNRVQMGALYVAVALLFFLLCQKLARHMGAGVRRYLHANANLLRGAQNAAA